MLTSGMCPTKRKGFTLIELMVVLLLASLSLTVLLPALTTDPISNTERLESFSARLLMFSSQVRSEQAAVIIDADTVQVLADALAVPSAQLTIEQPIRLNTAGACLSGAFTYSDGSVNIPLTVTPPLCELEVGNEE